MKKSITKNYIYNLLYQITALVVPLITTPYISRVLGAEAIGIYSFTLSVTTYFILFGTLGISLYGQREIAYLQDDKKNRTKTFWEIFLFRCITMSISILIFYFSFGIKNEFKIYYRILLVELLTYYIDISWFFSGMEEFKKTVSKNILIRIISLILVFILIKKPSDLTKYFIIYVLSNFIGNLSLWFYLPKYIQKIKFKELNILKHIKPTISLFIPQIAVQIYNVLDRTMLGAIISNKSEVGYYEQAQKYIKVLLTIESSLITVMIPRMANSFIKGEKYKIEKYMNKSFSFVMFLAFPMIVGSIDIAKEFVPIFYGEGYEKVGTIICLISPIILFVGLSNIIGSQYLLPTKKQKKYTIAVVSGAVINFVLNSIFIRKYYSFGASIATCIAELVVLVIELFMIRKEFKIKKILRNGVKYLLSSTIMLIFLYIIDIIIKNNIYKLILKVLVGVLSYIIILIILKDSFLMEAKNKILNKFRR